MAMGLRLAQRPRMVIRNHQHTQMDNQRRSDDHLLRICRNRSVLTECLMDSRSEWMLVDRYRQGSTNGRSRSAHTVRVLRVRDPR